MVGWKFNCTRCTLLGLGDAGEPERAPATAAIAFPELPGGERACMFGALDAFESENGFDCIEAAAACPLAPAPTAAAAATGMFVLPAAISPCRPKGFVFDALATAEDGKIVSRASLSVGCCVMA